MRSGKVTGVQLFIVIDRALLGRGVFGIFSNRAGAEQFLEASPGVAHLWEVRVETVVEGTAWADRIFAAYTHERLYDTYVFDGLYASRAHARDAAGDGGLVVEFELDNPESGTICPL